MSLSELKAQAEVGDDPKPAETDPEPIVDPEPDPDPADPDLYDPEPEPEPEPSDDFELELDGESDPDQQKHSPKDAIYHKMRKEKAKRQEAQSELQKVQDELAQMKAQLAGSQHKPAPTPSQPKNPDYPPVPVLYEGGINSKEQFNVEFQKWMAETRRIDSEAEQKRRHQSDFERQQEERKLRLAERAEKFLTENKVSVDRFSSALDRVVNEIDAAANLEGSAIYLLDKLGESSERVAFYLGTHDADLEKIKSLLVQEPDGLSAMRKMSDMASRLKPKGTKRISKAPEPDEPLQGDGTTKSSRKLQEAYDKASDERNMQKMKEVKRKAEQLGVKLK